LFPNISTSNVNQQSNQPVNMTDYDSFTASFASDVTADFLESGLIDPTSPLFGLDSLGGAELVSMPTNASNQTVSPHELALHDSPSLFGSAPPSGALTNLTSPDGFYQTSPDFISDNLDGQSWAPLFGNADQSLVHAMQRNNSHASNSSDSPNNSPQVQGVGAARSERPNSMHRNSTGSGVSKPRRRQGQLKDINYDPGDKVAAKRARNTLAARDSRARKAQHVEVLEATIEKLEAENESLRTKLRTHGFSSD
jgi:hypothetical protein